MGKEIKLNFRKPYEIGYNLMGAYACLNMFFARHYSVPRPRMIIISLIVSPGSLPHCHALHWKKLELSFWYLIPRIYRTPQPYCSHPLIPPSRIWSQNLCLFHLLWPAPRNYSKIINCVHLYITVMGWMAVVVQGFFRKLGWISLLIRTDYSLRCALFPHSAGGCLGWDRRITGLRQWFYTY